LKPKSDEPLSEFAFNFNMRRYDKAAIDVYDEAQRIGVEAWAATGPLFSST
jgi:hypothetical protein